MRDPSLEQEDNPQPSRFGRTAKPFAATDAAHAVVKAAERAGWELTNSPNFLRLVQHVEYGLSSEMEFAAILRWLGWCSFVHRLSEDVLQELGTQPLGGPRPICGL